MLFLLAWSPDCPVSTPGSSSIPSYSSHRYFSYLSKAGDKMRFDLALAASEARSVVTSHCNMLSVFFCSTAAVSLTLNRDLKVNAVRCILTCGDGATLCKIRGDWAVVAGSALICWVRLSTMWLGPESRTKRRRSSAPNKNRRGICCGSSC